MTIAEGSEVVFVIVGAKHIQPWIARTPRLRLLRGASKLLQDATHPEVVGKQLADVLSTHNATIDHSASAVDGVVVAAVSDLSEAPAVASALVDFLARSVPGLSWEAWWGSAPDFVSAVALQKASVHTAVAAQLQELPFARACETCRQETARERVRVVDEQVWVGSDCKARLELGDPAKGRTDWPCQDKSLTVDGVWAEDFRQLAEWGGRRPAVEGVKEVKSQVVGRHRSGNHLATICGDGNRMGDLFEALTKAGPTYSTLRQTASSTLNATLIDAVASAAAELSRGATVKVGIPHYVGGDDLLVSVRADAAWRFAHLVMKGFEELATTLQTNLPRPPDGATDETQEAHRQVEQAIANVSLGLGVVFSQEGTPFDECQKTAHAALAAAKNATRGARSAVCWVDLTEGSGVTGDRVVTADALEEMLNSPPTGVAALPASARSQLAQILAATAEQDRKAAIENWQKRTEANREGVPADIQLEDAAQLPAALSRARWWPTTNGARDDQDTGLGTEEEAR